MATADRIAGVNGAVLIVIAQGVGGRVIAATAFVTNIYGTCHSIKAKGIISSRGATVDLIA